MNLPPFFPAWQWGWTEVIREGQTHNRYEQEVTRRVSKDDHFLILYSFIVLLLQIDNEEAYSRLSNCLIFYLISSPGACSMNSL